MGQFEAQMGQLKAKTGQHEVQNSQVEAQTGPLEAKIGQLEGQRCQFEGHTGRGRVILALLKRYTGRLEAHRPTRSPVEPTRGLNEPT